MNALILQIIEQGGYLGIALLMVIENVIPPIPSEVIMGFGGVAVARGTMEFWPLLVAGTVGSTLGNYVWFLAGYKWGYEWLRPVLDRWGRWLTMDYEDLEKATAFFRKHGQWVVFALRFSPFLRTIVSLPAGLSHMSHFRFLAFTFAGAAIWNTILIFAGQWASPWLEEYETAMDYGLLALLALMFGWYVWRVATWKRR